jgi:hypothetical protein
VLPHHCCGSPARAGGGASCGNGHQAHLEALQAAGKDLLVVVGRLRECGVDGGCLKARALHAILHQALHINDHTLLSCEEGGGATTELMEKSELVMLEGSGLPAGIAREAK